MSENLTNEDLLRKKMEMEEKVVESISETIDKVFPDCSEDESEFHKETAYRIFQLDLENEELRHQLYYASSVTDSVVNLLIEKGILTSEELEVKMTEVHEKAKEDFQKSQEFIANEMQRQSEETSVAEI